MAIAESIGLSSRKDEHLPFGTKMVRTKINAWHRASNDLVAARGVCPSLLLRGNLAFFHFEPFLEIVLLAWHI